MFSAFADGPIDRAPVFNNTFTGDLCGFKLFPSIVTSHFYEGVPIVSAFSLRGWWPQIITVIHKNSLYKRQLHDPNLFVLFTAATVLIFCSFVWLLLSDIVYLTLDCRFIHTSRTCRPQ